MKGELESEELLEIKEKELKNLYEKYCYLNHMNELLLTDKSI